jgi:Skp family chaperone for outer membrane proteins
MVTRLSSVLAGLLLLAVLSAPSAQGQRIGYANQEALLANMPQMSEVQQKLQRAARQQQQELQKQQKQLQQEMQQYRQQQSLLSDSARAQRERELQQMQQELQKSSQQRQQQLRKRERELMQPLLEDLQSAIENVASEQNVDVVLRSQALLDVNENSSSVVNLSPDVAQQLGIQLQQAPSEPSPTVNPGNQGAPGGGGPGGGGQ